MQSGLRKAALTVLSSSSVVMSWRSPSGDALRVRAFITDLRVTARILEHLGLTSDAVPIAPARAPPDDPVSELEFGS